MAIIYSYPTVIPTANDLVLGTDVDQVDKPTKNFTVQSIIDLVTVSGNDLQAVLNNGNTATQNIVLTGNISATQYTDGTMTLTTGVGTGFTSITSTDFAGDLTGIIKSGSSIQSTVTGVTQNQGDNSTRLATTAYVDSKVDPSVLQYLGDSTGPFDLNLVSDDFKITGTANQIETTATAVAGNIGVINLKFPTAGVVLPNGSTATTQAATDDSTKVATTAFVRDYDDTQDLDFTGDSGTSSVLLNSQTLDFEGTTNEVVTAVTAQKVKFSLPSSVTISGTYTGATFAGDLLGTVNTATTGTTQSAGDNSTKIATTAYVDAAAGAKTLTYEGDAIDPFDLNLSTDTLKLKCSNTNITVTAAAVNANKGIITIDLGNNVGISGTMTAGVFTDGTFTGSSGTYTGYVSITSAAFVGPLTGNASTATALATAGTIQLDAGSGATQGVGSNAVTYTSGGDITLTTTLADTTVTAKALTNLPTPTSSAIAASDTILDAMAKLQGQITSTTGLAYEGTWDARIAVSTGTSQNSGSSSDTIILTNPNINMMVGTVISGFSSGSNMTITSVSSDFTRAFFVGQGGQTWTTATNFTFTAPNSANLSAGGNPDLTQASRKVNGHFYIVSNAGTAEPNGGGGTQIGPWAVGDWCIYVANGSATDEWQKLDQSNEVLGSGATDKIAKWTATNTLGTGLISDDGTTVTIGTNGNLTVQGDTILGDDAAADTITLNGPTTFVSTGIFNVGIGLGGATYGSAGQVLTSGGGSGVANTWTTPTVGVVTSITGNYGITVAGTAAVPTIAVTSDVNNLINQATAKATPVGADSILINDSAATNVLKKATLTSIKTFTAESWLLDVDGGTAATISDGDQVGFNSGAGIVQTLSTKDVSTALRYDDSDNSGTIKNFIEAATTETPASGDFLIFGDQAGGSAINSVKKATIANIVDLGNETLAQVLSNGNTTSGTDIAVSANDDITLTDSSKIKWDFGGGLELFSTNSSNNVISTGTAANLYVKSDILVLQKSNGGDMLSHGGQGVAISWRGGTDDGVKFQTTQTGTTTTGISQVNGSGLNINSNAVDTLITLNRTTGIWSIDNDSSYHLNFKATSLGTTNLTLKSTGEVVIPDYGSGNNTGTEAYNLAVDSSGNVIETPSSGGGSGGGTAKGGQFSKVYTTGAIGASGIAFTITRATGAAMAFDVMFTGGGTGSGTSTCKKYTVVKKYGLTDASIYYNKIIDTGPALGGSGTADYNIVFDVSGSAGDAIECNITPVGVASQEIGITIDLGFGKQDAVVVMN